MQGDFTKSLVNDPPRKIWTRELKVSRRCVLLSYTSLNLLQLAGVSNTSTLYKRGIRICTGTGIGAALATCIQSPYWYVSSIISLLDIISTSSQVSDLDWCITSPLLGFKKC